MIYVPVGVIFVMKKTKQAVPLSGRLRALKTFQTACIAFSSLQQTKKANRLSQRFALFFAPSSGLFHHNFREAAAEVFTLVGHGQRQLESSLGVDCGDFGVFGLQVGGFARVHRFAHGQA